MGAETHVSMGSVSKESMLPLRMQFELVSAIVSQAGASYLEIIFIGHFCLSISPRCLLRLWIKAGCLHSGCIRLSLGGGFRTPAVHTCS